MFDAAKESIFVLDKEKRESKSNAEPSEQKQPVNVSCGDCCKIRRTLNNNTGVCVYGNSTKYVCMYTLRC